MPHRTAKRQMRVSKIGHTNHERQEPLAIKQVWKKWRFSAPHIHLWLIKVWFSASAFVVKIATLTKLENVGDNAICQYVFARNNAEIPLIFVL